MERKENRILYFICKYCRRGFCDMPTLTEHKRQFHLDEILKRRQFQKPVSGEVNGEQGNVTEAQVGEIETSKSKPLVKAEDLHNLPENHIVSAEPCQESAASTNTDNSVGIGKSDCTATIAEISTVESDFKRDVIPSASELLQCKYCKTQLPHISELLAHHAAHERAFRCQKCMTSFGTFPSLNAHIKSGCSEKKPTPPPPEPPSLPLPVPPIVETEEFYIPPICRSIYDEFYVRSDESSISSDPSEDEEAPPSKPVPVRSKSQDKIFKYHCRFCGKGWNFLSQNLQHERIHIKSHRCTQCPAKFAEFYLLRNHCVMWHGPLSRGRVAKSKSKVGKKKQKRNIVKIPNSIQVSPQPEARFENRVKCSLCPRLLKNNENLKVHMRIHSGVKPFACKHCPYKGAQWGQLNTHQKCHTEKHEFQCHLCSASYRNEPHLSRHIRHVHDLAAAETENSKSINGEGDHVNNTGDIDELPSPQIGPKKPPLKLTEKTFDCSKCSKTFTTLNRLASHEAFHLDQRKFTCKMCEVGFTRNPDLVRHNKSKNHLAALAETARQEKPSPSHLSRPSIKIKIASSKLNSTKISNTASSSGVELNQNQNQTLPKKFPCLVCEKSFTAQSSLGNHIKTHRGENGKLQCSVCPKWLTTSASLRTHMRKHSGEKPYSCEHCGKQFMYLTSFKRHVKSHSGERQFVCTECPSNFVLKSDLTRHFYRVHVFEGKDKKKKKPADSMVIELGTEAGEEDEEEDLSDEDMSSDEEVQDVFEFSSNKTTSTSSGISTNSSAKDNPRLQYNNSGAVVTQSYQFGFGGLTIKSGHFGEDGI